MRSALALVVSLAFTLLAVSGAHAQSSQLTRNIPRSAAVGTLLISVFPAATIEGDAVRFSAGSTIRDANNRIVMPASLSGEKLIAFVSDSQGFVHKVWLVSVAEARAILAAKKGRR